jgi:integrase
VFGSETGDLFSKERVCELWRRTCERAKVKNPHLHDLRGEAGSQLLEAGVAIHEVRDALGHSSTTMTSAYLRTRVNSLSRHMSAGTVCALSHVDNRRRRVHSLLCCATR